MNNTPFFVLRYAINRFADTLREYEIEYISDFLV